MKRILFAAMLLLTLSANAQTNLAGRVYHHPNILADEINKVFKEAARDMDKVRADAIAKAEEKKGHKLTTEELAKVDKEVEEAQKMLEAMRTGMKTAVTVTFKDETHMVMKADMKIDDDVMKAAGIGWAKRKMIKLATNIMPAQKGTYVVKNNQVFFNDGEEADTMSLSADGKYLYGKLDEKQKFRLMRIK